MRRIILIAVLGGVALIAGILVFQLLGTYWYLRSPQRVVNGALTHLLDAKSFTVNVAAEDDAKNGMSFNVKGPINKQLLTVPTADLQFSFQAQDQAFYGNGQAQAANGKIYLRFDQIAGIEGVLPGALQSIWAGLDVGALLAVGRDRLFPGAADFTEADLQAVVAIAKKHLPFAVVGETPPVFIDNALCNHYRVVLDRAAMTGLFYDVKTAVKGSALSAGEKSDLDKAAAGLPPATGEVWVARNDGTLREALLIFKGATSSFHIDLSFSSYNSEVKVAPPVTSQPLIELIRRLAGVSFSGTQVKLPFDLPVPIYNTNVGIPTVPTASGNGPAKDLGALPNLLKLFYGTDQLFQGK